MGRKFIHTAILLGALLLGACTGNPEEIAGNPGEGAVAFTLAMPKSRTTTADAETYPWDCCAIRIYKYVADEAGERSRELIRRYDSPSEMPASLWLLAGEYAITVEAGSKAEATFDEPTYQGEQDFKIVEGATTSVTVDCRLVNTIIRVAYDATIPATFKEKFCTTVAIGESYDQSRVDKGEVPSLAYAKTRNGYFILPEETTAFCWQFTGKGEKNGQPLELTKTGSKAIVPEAGVCYELSLRYSPDLGGSLEFTLTVDESVDEIFDPIIFLPTPQIEGYGFEIGETRPYVSGQIAYSIGSIADMREIQVQVDGATFAVPATAAYAEDANGIAIDFENPTSMRLMLGEKFFARLSGGDHTLTLTAVDQDDAEGTKESIVRTQGALPVPENPWFDDRIWRGCVLQEASDVKMEYRRQGETQWTAATLTLTADETYSMPAAIAALGSAYEYRLSIDGTTIGAAQTAAYPLGPQVYNAGFEVWTGSLPLVPYTSETDRNDQWWDTGNHGSSKANTNVTTNEADARPGSAGTTSAKLASQKASVMGIGKFAAGNIFVGKYLGTNIPNGVIGFGKPFLFTYRPKALRFWYKGTVGTVDNAGGSVSNGDADVAQVYICLCKMDGPHVVDTRYSDTFLNFAANSKTMAYCTALNGKNSKNDHTDGHIIAWAEWNNTQSMAEWTEITLDLHYNEEYEGEVPTYLMLTASASKYGDYFAGSTGSTMYLDDMELIY
ncbi:MAG: PCMD domain-containing protein [Alistipes sp.]|nr:PCMD domain-containing protein [Alistipes sp.]